VASGGVKQPNSNVFSYTPLANLTAVEVILVPLVIPAGFRPPNGWEAMNGK
jgi:hypothetical protein